MDRKMDSDFLVYKFEFEFKFEFKFKLHFKFFTMH